MSKVERNVLICLVLLTACSDPAAAPLNLETCDPTESPTELLRLEGTHIASPVDAFDLGKAVSVSYALERDEDPASLLVPSRYSLVDNCGGSPLHLPETFGLRSGAANVGGEIVLCGSDEPFEERGVWELLTDGSRGQSLGLGDRCMGDTFSYGVRDPSFGVVYDDEDGVGVAVTQSMPDGTTRLIADPGSPRLSPNPQPAAGPLRHHRPRWRPAVLRSPCFFPLHFA